jgi:hypothetical protein
MVTVGSVFKTEKLETEEKHQWKSSPTVKNYTNFSELGINSIDIPSKVSIIESPSLVASEYKEAFLGEHDRLLDLNRRIQNICASAKIEKDSSLVFGSNSAVIGNLNLELTRDCKLNILLGDYNLFCLTMSISVREGVNAVLELDSKSAGFTYLRIKEYVSKYSKLALSNRHIKDKFLFLYGDGILRESASLDVTDYVYADSGAHYDCVQNVEQGFSSKSNVIGRGVINGPSSLIFRGMLKIYEEKCEGNFSTKTLNLSSGDAFTDSIPMLDIRANNVIARHSSAIEGISDSNLFYLMSRGLSKEDSRNLIIDSMLG